ncbi:MAG TPA: plastocyanin/azurin family copper-binding protein [Chloroflexota bacterium]|nr:plastocyanin/azurin family copper-binding protein [Chloroflexota bacterium]
MTGKCTTSRLGKLGRRRVLAGIAAVGALSISGCAVPDGEAGESAATAAARLGGSLEAQQKAVEQAIPQNVAMTPNRFDPDILEIRLNERVVWRNNSNVPHTVTFDPGQAQTPANVELPAGVQPFGSDTLAQGQNFEYQFTVPGAYKYVCRLHESAGMLGQITVR